MSMLLGTFAHVWASIVAVPVAIAVTAIIFWFYRWSIVQRVVMPGADECRRIEEWHGWRKMHGTGEHKPNPAELQAYAQVSHGLLLRNGMNAIAVAIVFLAVFTGSHALLLAL